MGVRGLESFIERDQLGCKKVNIADAAKLHKKLTGQPAVVVVDACSCTRALYRPLPWLPGGQLKEFQVNIENLVKRFRSVGVEPVFFFDGSLPEQKTATWIKRKTQKIPRVEGIFHLIKFGHTVQQIECDLGESMCCIGNIDVFMIDVLKNNGCKVFSSISECDEEIAKYATANNCLAILAQDSDYLIYPGNWHYWSMKHFNGNAMKTVEYDRKRLEECLRLPRKRLPLWASLMGTDILHYDDVKVFHDFLRELGHCGPRANEIASFVRDNSEVQIKHILQKLSDASKNLSALLVESIASYDIHQMEDPADSIVHCSEDENWEEILRVVLEKHTKCDFPNFIYCVTVLQNYRCGECTEDYSIKNVPPNQMVLKKLRQKSYGILLQEKPRPKNGKNQVKELVVNGHDFGSYDIVDPIPPQVHHPGLLSLWSEKGHDDLRWDLLCSSIGVDVNKMRRIPLKYVIPALSLFYVLKEGVKIKRWEARAIVASVVTLSQITVDRLARLHVSLIDPRAVHLYTLVTRSFEAVYNLNVVCGNPVPSSETLMSFYQDGKLFHIKYSEARMGENACKLCGDKETVIENFRLIMKLLPPEKLLE